MPALASLAYRLRMLAASGRRVHCPLCGSRFRRFRDLPQRRNAVCWRCHSYERHRAMWLYLEAHPDLLRPPCRLLHFAPEPRLRARLSALSGVEHVSTDLRAPDVDVTADITSLPFEEGSFDAVICAHVLEHIDDDAAAMRELRRVLRPGGWLMVLVPYAAGRAESYEDPAVASPQQRLVAYFGSEHVRLYGRDLKDRLQAAGFSVTQVVPSEEFSAEAMRRHQLLEEDPLFLCRAA